MTIERPMSLPSSRRGFLTLAAGSTVAAAIPAAALATTPAVDPIYAVIEQHRAETRAYGEAIGVQGRLEESLPDEIRRGPRVQFGRKDGQPYYLYSHEHIDHRLDWMPDFANTSAIRARLHDEFDRDMKEQRRKQEECGLTAAELRTEGLCHSCQELAWAIATTAPTSMAGIAAVLRYANEWEDAGEEWPVTDTIGSEGWHYQLRRTLAEAIEKAGGLV